MISITAMARREGMEEAADVVTAQAEKIMRRAEKEHKKFFRNEDGFSNDIYEGLESEASLLLNVAGLIRRRSKRAAS